MQQKALQASGTITNAGGLRRRAWRWTYNNVLHWAEFLESICQGLVQLHWRVNPQGAICKASAGTAKEKHDHKDSGCNRAKMYLPEHVLPCSQAFTMRTEMLLCWRSRWHTHSVVCPTFRLCQISHEFRHWCTSATTSRRVNQK